MGKRKAYTDKFRATAVVMLEAQGYPDKNGALSLVSGHLDVPPSTLRGWFSSKNNPPPAELRDEKRGDMVAMLSAEIKKAFNEMDNKRAETDYRSLATAIGIFIDKKQLLSGNPTESSEQRIIIQREGLSTVPEHLASGPIGRGDEPEQVQRPRLRA